MKKILMLIMVVIFAISSVSFAQDEATAKEKIVDMVLGSDMVIHGDTLFNFKSNEIMAGIGVPIARMFDGVIEARAEFASDFGDSVLIGGGIGIDVLKFTNLLTTKMDVTIPLSDKITINPTVGVLAMADLNEGINGITPIGYLSIIEAEF